MALTTSELTAKYIGEVLTCVIFKIPNNGPTIYVTPSDSDGFTFDGNAYLPHNLSGSGFQSTSGEFQDATLAIGNTDRRFMQYIKSTQYNAMRGTQVTFFQTLRSLLNNPTKKMNYANYIISALNFDKEQINCTLSDPMNQTGIALPLYTANRVDYPSVGKWNGS